MSVAQAWRRPVAWASRQALLGLPVHTAPAASIPTAMTNGVNQRDGFHGSRRSASGSARGGAQRGTGDGGGGDGSGDDQGGTGRSLGGRSPNASRQPPPPQQPPPQQPPQQQRHRGSRRGVAFDVLWLDKALSKQGGPRVPEKTLKKVIRWAVWQRPRVPKPIPVPIPVLTPPSSLKPPPLLD